VFSGGTSSVRKGVAAPKDHDRLKATANLKITVAGATTSTQAIRITPTKT
jgi:hypothetical protein